MADVTALRHQTRRYALVAAIVLAFISVTQVKAYRELKRGTALGDTLVAAAHYSRAAEQESKQAQAHISVVGDSILKLISKRSEMNALRQRRIEDRIVQRIVRLQSTADTVRASTRKRGQR